MQLKCFSQSIQVQKYCFHCYFFSPTQSEVIILYFCFAFLSTKLKCHCKEKNILWNHTFGSNINLRNSWSLPKFNFNHFLWTRKKRKSPLISKSEAKNNPGNKPWSKTNKSPRNNLYFSESFYKNKCIFWTVQTYILSI